MELEIKNLIDQSVSIFNVLGPFIIYIPQYLLMGKNKTVGSFSCLICYIMLTAHILRLIFHQMISFHISLYIQSYFLIIIHSMLLFQYLRVSHLPKKRLKPALEHSVSANSQNELELMDCEKQVGRVNHANLKTNTEETQYKGSICETGKSAVTQDLIQEDELKHQELINEEMVSTDVDTKEDSKEDMHYMLDHKSGNKHELELDQKSNLHITNRDMSYQRKFMCILLAFTMFGAFYFTIFKFANSKKFASFTALFSCICESMLPVPQFVANCRMKSFESLSFFMVFCWLFGDVMKFFFLLDEGQPLQFIIGTANIIVFDCLIVLQYFLYRNNHLKKTKKVSLNRITV